MNLCHIALPEILDNDTPAVLTCNAESAIGALPCDAWHHYYHYQSSAQYLWLADSLRALGKNEEALKAYERSVFQDHFNQEALEGKKGTRGEGQGVTMPKYDKHPARDADFRASVGEGPGLATVLHDKAVEAMQAKDYAKAIVLLEEALCADPEHSNSYFTRGKCFYLQGDYERARADFANAIQFSHLWHDAYHRMASHEHLTRGRKFLDKGELDLAVNEFTKALDLYKDNKAALTLRAEVQRVKGA